MRVSVHRLSMHLDIVETGNRHPAEEVLNVSVSTLASIRVGLFVQGQEFEFEEVAMGTREFFVLLEVVGEVPALWFHRLFAKPGVHQSIRGLEILIDQKAGCHQCGTDVVHVLASVLFRKIGSQPKRVDSTTKQRRQSVLVLATGKPPQDGSATGTCDLVASVLNSGSQCTDDAKTFFISRLIRILRRHLFQSQLVNDFVSSDQLRFGSKREP